MQKEDLWKSGNVLYADMCMNLNLETRIRELPPEHLLKISPTAGCALYAVQQRTCSRKRRKKRTALCVSKGPTVGALGAHDAILIPAHPACHTDQVFCQLPILRLSVPHGQKYLCWMP